MPPKLKRPSLSVERRPEVPLTTPSPFPLSTTIAPHAITLPPEATELAAVEQDLARHFLTAWRRTHEFLLEAARWMAEARETVEHGRWGLWLRVVGMSDDKSEELRHIWWRAQQHAAFAEGIRQGRINATTAGLLAPPSVPAEIIDEVLESETPPKTKVLERRLIAVRQAARVAHSPAASPLVQIPRNAENGKDEAVILVPLSPPLRDAARELTAQIHGYAREPETITPDDWALLADLLRALQVLATAQRRSATGQ